MDPRRLFGNSAEAHAARFLKKNGLTILEKQYRTKFGEIDLIARDGDEIVFVEVKARRTNDFGHPEESVTQSKLQKIHRTGEWYLQQKKLSNAFRIDVVAITYGHGEPEVHYIKGV